jgi:SP family sugar porter-like MFS transporter
LGASFSGRLGDKFGRKKVLMVTALLFGVSAIGSGFSNSVPAFVFYRILGGLAVGGASVLAPVYIAEVSPAHLRGRMVSINQLTIVVGISAIGSGFANTIPAFVFYRILGGLAVGGASVLAPVYIAEVSPAHLRGRMVSINQLTIVIGISLAYYSNWFLLGIGENAWRWMFAAEAVPALFFFTALFIIPESPRWLVARNNETKAKAVLEKIADGDFSTFELKEIKASLEGNEKRGTLKDAFKKKYAFILFLGIFLAVFQQWSGINVIFFYAPDIFAKAHLGVDTALFQTTLIGLMNVVFTILAMRVIDKTGRKKLLLIGAAGMAVCYVVIGYLFAIGRTGDWLLLTFIVITPAFFAFGLGPTVWVILSEIFPNKIRGAAMSVATFSLWVACYLLTLTFPVFVEAFSAAVTFWIYAVICIVGFTVIFKYLPETKGVTLEKLEKLLVKES